MSHIHDDKVEELELKATAIRQDIISMLVEAGSGHSAGPLGMADVFTALYFHILHHEPSNPEWEDRDRLILSCGHICPVRYVAMAHAGYFPMKELKTLRKFGTRLQGHPERLRLPGTETTSGPLGEGLGQAAGMALAAKMDGKKWRTYCILSDGEHDEGLHWEAVMFANKYGLDNLTAIIDRNNIQIDGTTEDVMPLEPFADKYRAFNWHVLECSGNDMADVIRALEESKGLHQRPTVILAHTVPGKGVSYMENNYLWHSQPFKPGQEEQALKELRAQEIELAADHAKL